MCQEEELRKLLMEEKRVKDIVRGKIDALNVYEPHNSEIISYRLAEILITAKNIYTDCFARMIKVDAKDEKSAWENLTSLRMSLLHIKDCIEDFDMMLLELMQDKNENEEEKG